MFLEVPGFQGVLHNQGAFHALRPEDLRRISDFLSA